MISFKSMDCPVCGEFHFSGPSKYLSEAETKEELADYEQGEVKCTHCGWVYDLGQTKTPDSHDGQTP